MIGVHITFLDNLADELNRQFVILKQNILSFIYYEMSIVLMKYNNKYIHYVVIKDIK